MRTDATKYCSAHDSEPGTYRTCAQPLTSEGEASAECSRAEATTFVSGGPTSEVVLISQCEGDPTGGINALTVPNDAPCIPEALEQLFRNDLNARSEGRIRLHGCQPPNRIRLVQLEVLFGQGVEPAPGPARARPAFALPEAPPAPKTEPLPRPRERGASFTNRDCA